MEIPLTVPTILTIIGGVILIAGLFNGFEAQIIKIPSLPRVSRIVAIVIGFIFVGAGIWLSLPPPTAISSSDATRVPATLPAPSPHTEATAASEIGRAHV